MLPGGGIPDGEVEDYLVELVELDFGDAPVTSPDLPVIGVITGEYTKRDTYYLHISAAFGGNPR